MDERGREDTRRGAKTEKTQERGMGEESGQDLMSVPLERG
jgi:hypothetical protein